jgi:predicted alpha/beta-hydrolase family hydrolase
MKKIIFGHGNIPIIFLHGTHTPYDSFWIKQIYELIDPNKYQVICPEFPSLYKENNEHNDKTDELTLLLRDFILSEQFGQNLIIIGKSLGAKIAVGLTKSIDIGQLILLGYPFTYSTNEIRNDRLKKINVLTVATQIIQGSNDQYGSKGNCSNLKLMENIQLEWIEDTDHNFFSKNEKIINEENLNRIRKSLDKIL